MKNVADFLLVEPNGYYYVCTRCAQDFKTTAGFHRHLRRCLGLKNSRKEPEKPAVQLSISDWLDR